ncbi:MAG TPA: OsmC family protein [Ktedonobacteraceae bacterium]|nr:OsmC family protein [Ktedonobacteraceae bacterium]
MTQLEDTNFLPSCLRPVDTDGLTKLVEKGKTNPSSGKVTLRAKTVTEGQFRNLTYIRDLQPVVIDEPPHLLGQNTAPNPSEAVLAALGACLAVGFVANATQRGIQLRNVTVELEGDIDVSAVWGLGDIPEGKTAGFTAIRVKAHLDADAAPEVLAEIVEHATKWSPVANTMRNPVALTATHV